MSYNDLIDEVQNTYYENNYIPSVIGGSPETTLYTLLFSITALSNNMVEGFNQLSNWKSDDVTWYTKFLREELPIPYFNTDSDRVYLERIKMILDLKYNSPHLSNRQRLYEAIAFFINSFQQGTYQVIASNLRYSKGGNSYTWVDNDDLDGYHWSQEGSILPEETPEAYWVGGGDIFGVLDVLTLRIDAVQVPEGDDWRIFWDNPKNYSRILTIIKFFIPVNAFYEFSIEYTT